MSYIVEMRGISKSFAAVIANKSVDLKIPANSIHAIIGENGAGKSTIMRILYGFYRADEGEIYIDGRRRHIDSPRDAIQLGIGMVHQHFMLVPPLTVTENVILGEEPAPSGVIDYARAKEKVAALAGEFGFHIDPSAKIEDLSVGEQQRVELLKILYRGASILILDEPTAVLTPQEVQELFKILRRLREQGKTIILITHKLAEVLSLSDNVTVMRDGRVIGEVETGKTSAAELARMMVGRDVLERVSKSAAKPGEAVLEVKGLSFKEGPQTARLEDISFQIRAGEILGIAGVEGNGQTELIEILAGLRKPTRGQVLLEGRDITGLDARKIKALGVAHVPEDRHKRGLLLEFNLADNTILGVQYRKPIAGRWFLNRRAIIARAERLIKDFDVRPPDPFLPARALSGGNQQKLIIAREFDIKPKLLLASQPTRGVDIGAIEFIHQKIIALRDAGAAVLLVSAELDEILTLSDRIAVIFQGRIVGIVDPQTVSQQEIGLMMTGGKVPTPA